MKLNFRRIKIMREELKYKWLNSPNIDLEVYDNLPVLMQDIIAPMKSVRSKDVLLLSSLVSIGSVFTSWSGIYSDKRVYPNLYLFIVAPPASEKGVMLWCEHVIKAVHVQQLKVSQQKIKEALKHNRSNPDNKLDIPNEIIHIMAGDTSASGLIHQLDKNNGVCILIEEEADTIANSLQQDWGNYSDKLRKAFHHGRLSQKRISYDTFIEIEKPKLSICITGTPSQAPGIIKTIDDGMSSRFCYYVFEAQKEWKDVSPNGEIVDFEEYYKQISLKLLSFYNLQSNQPINFNLTQEQWARLNNYYEDLLADYQQIDSIVKRLGLIQYRIAMIFSILRSFESDELKDSYFCSDIDFNIAESICKTIFENDLLFFEALPNSKPITIGRDKFLNLLESNKEYSKAELSKLAEDIAKPRTVTKYLKQLLHMQKIEKISHGFYKKIVNN